VVNITTGGTEDTSDKEGGLTTDQKIQIGVGIPASLAALAAIWGVWHAYKGHERKKNKNTSGASEVQEGGPGGGKPEKGTAPQPEKYGTKSELDAQKSQPPPAELPGF